MVIAYAIMEIMLVLFGVFRQSKENQYLVICMRYAFEGWKMLHWL
jgi:hypothetical protein